MTRIDRQLARNCPILVTTVCLAALFTTGCDECSEGEMRCQGEDVLGSCQRGNENGKAVWTTSHCPVVCRQVGTDATCVESREPIAECANLSAGSLPVCFSGEVAYCWHGYAFSLEGCDADTHCRMTPCGGKCVVGDAADPRCLSDTAPFGLASFCDGNSRAGCECGFEKRRDPCGAYNFCHDVAGDARCTGSSTPDPRCGDPAQPGSGFCDGDVVGICWFGFANTGFCPTGQTCKVVTAPPFATCSYPGQ